MPTSRGRSSIDAPSPSPLILRLGLLVLLHAVYGLVTLLAHLVWRPWKAYEWIAATGTPAELQRDSKHWSKLPRNLSIAFQPGEGATWRLWRSRGRRGTALRAQQIAQDVSKLVSWSLELGVERLTVYEEQARFNGMAVCEELLRAGLDIMPLNKAKAADGPPPLFLVSDARRPAGPTLRLSLLSKMDGKGHIAEAAGALADAAQAGFITAADVTVDFLEEKLHSSLGPEPELLIVLGEPSLRLHGYSPWHIRTTEIYHEPSLSLLGPARLSYQSFRRALAAYAVSEQRKGR